jgi:hypothetical protein
MTPYEQSLAPCRCGKSLCGIPYGTCHCGCGEVTTVLAVSRADRGWVKGEPTLFIKSHARLIRPEIDRGPPFLHREVLCRRIPLSQGLGAIVSDSDYLRIAQRKWFATWNGKNWYAVRHPSMEGGKRGPLVYMHREILGLGRGDPTDTDHIETGETLDNSRPNLRPATPEQNGRNIRRYKSNKTGRKGVCKEAGSGLYVVQIRTKGKRMTIGRSKSFEEACAIREEAEQKYHGEFARAY